MKQKKTVFGVIIGNRGFFPDRLAKEGRAEILKILKEEGYGTVALSQRDSKYGAVETRPEAKKCAEIFKKHANEIDGILVSLPNFGDERGVADTIQMADLNVPVLVQAYPDEVRKMKMGDRRDSFCGKMSVCNNLYQYGIPYTLTSNHTMHPSSKQFKKDLAEFAATCRVVKGLSNARLGAIGARPAAFNTVRYSEKLLQLSGISVETLDLSEVFGQIERLKDTDPKVKKELQKIRSYVSVEGVPEDSLMKMAKLRLVITRWMSENELDGMAFQCWTAIEEYLGIAPCAIMSMLSDAMMPSACEVDITGLIGMYALQLASQEPSALVDWNNNYGKDPNKAVVFHCSNLPKSVFEDMKMSYQEILAETVGQDSTWGTCAGRISAGPMSFARVSTDDFVGDIVAYVGEGEFTTDPLNTFGGAGVVKVNNLQELLRCACMYGYEHHVAINKSLVAKPVYEALSNYLGWDVYYHQ